MPSPVITLQEIADRAGVSRMTVSLALRNRSTVSAETRRRIQDLATVMGYRANPLVSAWQTQVRARTKPGFQGTLVWVNTNPDPTWWSDPQGCGAYLNGAKARADGAGFKLEVLHLADYGGKAGKLHPSRAVAHLRRVCRARGIAGVILPAATVEALIEADWTECAVALLGKSPLLYEAGHIRPIFHEAQPDLYHNFLTLWHELRARGARRIGLALNRAPGDLAHSVQAACCLGLQAGVGEEERVPPLLSSDIGEGMGGEFERWLEAHAPDAVVSNSTHALCRMRAKGVRVPEDVQFAMVSGQPGGGNCSGIDLRREAIGAAVIDLVVTQLLRNERGRPAIPLEVLVKGVWQEGETARPPLSK